MAQQRFGSAHTARKLSALKSYLCAFATALSGKFKLAYFDAFAGTGEIELTQGTAPLLDGADMRTFIDGSAQLALQCEPKFDRYVLVEKSASKARTLAKLKDQHASVTGLIEIKQGDANKELQSFCKTFDRKGWRAVVFLDPYGNQVVWKTMEAIAATQAIDLWYLFPAGLGVHRQIGRDGTVHYTHGDSIDAMLGTKEWRTEFLQTEVEPDLFSVHRERTKKIATPESVTRFMIERRLRPTFEGAVLDDWLTLGSRNVAMYSLVFASANPDEKAKVLAHKLAGAVLRSTKRGRTK